MCRNSFASLLSVGGERIGSPLSERRKQRKLSEGGGAEGPVGAASSSGWRGYRRQQRCVEDDEEGRIARVAEIGGTVAAVSSRCSRRRFLSLSARRPPLLPCSRPRWSGLTARWPLDLTGRRIRGSRHAMTCAQNKPAPNLSPAAFITSSTAFARVPDFGEICPCLAPHESSLATTSLAFACALAFVFAAANPTRTHPSSPAR